MSFWKGLKNCSKGHVLADWPIHATSEGYPYAVEKNAIGVFASLQVPYHAAICHEGDWLLSFCKGLGKWGLFIAAPTAPNAIEYHIYPGISMVEAVDEYGREWRLHLEAGNG